MRALPGEKGALSRVISCGQGQRMAKYKKSYLYTFQRLRFASFPGAWKSFKIQGKGKQIISQIRSNRNYVTIQVRIKL
ncbi:MAG: hypothetical protein CME32_13760 [Gimesia sp.]|nr:hypothetical protein [Gimesia sp.]